MYINLDQFLMKMKKVLFASFLVQVFICQFGLSWPGNFLRAIYSDKVYGYCNSDKDCRAIYPSLSCVFDPFVQSGPVKG